MKQFYRKANTEEINFYEKEIYPLQDRIFEIASLYDDKIYLTGGTALSRFYFNHRLSEDLDFFTLTDDLKLIAGDFIGRLTKKGFIIDIEKLEIYFARFFIREKNYILKIEFVREYNLFSSLIKTEKGIYINNLEDIGGNKITAFEDRAEIKDIIDLYFITEKIPLQRLFEIADLKRALVPYENLLTINTTGLSGKGLIINDIDEEKLVDFLNKLKENTEKEIKKKEKEALTGIDEIIYKTLWDFPPEDRKIDKNSIPVIRRRLKDLAFPHRIILEKML
ncbi:hypothetical protein C4588_07470 [Candidatus Parcubacteria bacterium]|nr:MAG: hypothetical protein C4588_07470 [Candidatus Parcubacteria bacterium]